MSRPTRVHIDTAALLHNVTRVKQCASNQKIIAMVKANAYGCGLAKVLPVLNDHVDAFGVACLEEALSLRSLGIKRDCVLFQGIFSSDELHVVAENCLQCVLHNIDQLRWILATPLDVKIKVWVKVNTGMNRLGFALPVVSDVITALLACPWIDSELGLMTHLSCADEPGHASNQLQFQQFNDILLPTTRLVRSIANSAAIFSLPEMHADVVRPGIMLYGVSPFANQTGADLGLRPVMQFVSAITAIHHCAPHAHIGYGATWSSDKATKIGIVAVGYGDGYPRQIAQGTCVWVNGCEVPIVGRVSMDMLTVDLTNCHDVKLGDTLELWGQHIPVESVAQAAGTIGYELLCQLSPRVHRNLNQ